MDGDEEEGDAEDRPESVGEEESEDDEERSKEDGDAEDRQTSCGKEEEEEAKDRPECGSLEEQGVLAESEPHSWWEDNDGGDDDSDEHDDKDFFRDSSESQHGQDPAPSPAPEEVQGEEVELALDFSAEQYEHWCAGEGEAV